MNCKEGDLAIVSGCPVNEINGQIVEVMSMHGPLLDFGIAWNCTSPSMREHGFLSLPVPDVFLRPISGVPVHDEQLDEVSA